MTSFLSTAICVSSSFITTHWTQKYSFLSAAQLSVLSAYLILSQFTTNLPSLLWAIAELAQRSPPPQFWTKIKIEDKKIHQILIIKMNKSIYKKILVINNLTQSIKSLKSLHENFLASGPPPPPTPQPAPTREGCGGNHG
jgi:hypothetical protein